MNMTGSFNLATFNGGSKANFFWRIRFELWALQLGAPNRKGNFC